MTLPQVLVQGQGNQTLPPIGSVPDTAATEYVVSRDGLGLTDQGGIANPYRAVSLLPSVNAPAIDPYGLANQPGGNKGIRIRGELSQHGDSISTIEGVPITGVDPGPGSQWLIASENVRAVSLFSGPIAPDHFAFFTTAGVIDTKLRWPELKPGLEFSQGFGSNSFLRSFGRVDSGEILNNTTSVFASGSWTDANKWRGAGKGADGNMNFAFGIDTHPFDRFDAKLFFSYATERQNTYRGLTYAQAQNLGQFRYLDFFDSAAIPGNTTNYAGFNRQTFTDWMLLSELTYRFDNHTKITIKPYYFNESGYYLDGMANGMVRQWLIDHDYYGLTAEAQTRFAETDFKIGYWWNSAGLPGPPNAWKMYTPNAGGGLTFSGWPILAQQTSRHEQNSVYAMIDKRLGALDLQFGARYMRDSLPGINQYNAMGVGDVGYEAALAQSSGIIANRSVSGWSTGAFLPYMSAKYDVNRNLTLKASAGQNYGAPGFDVWPVFQQNSAALLARGITADSLWHSIKPEISSNLDAGLVWRFGSETGAGSGSIEPLGYVFKSTNKAVSYDSGIGVPYSQNVADTHAYGAQLMAHYLPLDNLNLFASASYTRQVFDNNLPTIAGASASTVAATMVQGLQLPDVPYWIASAGAQYVWNDFSFTPILHFVGSRYGDAAHTQPIGSYTTVDLNFGYEHKFDWGILNASLSVTNLFDTAYIGFINNSYYQNSLTSNAIYFPGAPRTILGKLAIKL